MLNRVYFGGFTKNTENVISQIELAFESEHDCHEKTSQKGQFLPTLPILFSKSEVFVWEVCVSERPVTHTSHMKTSLFRKSVGRVCQNQAQNRLFLEKTS